MDEENDSYFRREYILLDLLGDYPFTPLHFASVVFAG